MKIVAASCCKLQSVSPQPVWREIRAQVEEPHFAALLTAVYDDHDFLGNNRYGGDHPTELRDAARRAFVSAFGPAMTGAEVYRVHRLGLVDLFVLDARYHRKSPARSDMRPRRGAGRGTVELARGGAGIQQCAVPHGRLVDHAVQRMVQLLRAAPGRFVLSGDVQRNAAYDDSGALELITSAVARKGVVFGSPRRNDAVLRFDAERLQVDMRSLKAQWRLRFDLPLEHWTLGA